MAIREIWIPEAVVVVFLALPLFKSLVRDKRRSRTTRAPDGLVWLPCIALGITAGIFPAYGFRPECLPVLVFALVINAVNLVSFLTGTTLADDYGGRKPFFALFALVFLAAAAVPMFVFSPIYGHKKTAGPVRTLKVAGPDNAYYVRIYENETNPAFGPVIFLVPPEFGSAVSVDLVCMRLLENNFTVVTYYREGYDTPLTDENGRKHRVSVARLLKYRRVYRKATGRASVNSMGKMLEADRRADAAFLLPRLSSFVQGMGNGRPLVLAGYGAGGSALAYVAGEDGFASRFFDVLGAIAIESRLWSAYRDEPRPVPEIPASAGILKRYWTIAAGRLNSLKPQGVIRSGVLPGENRPESDAERPRKKLPVLYLVSGRAITKQTPYQAVFDTLYTGSGPAALAAVESAGPLDYQDFPLTHPVYSFFLPGQKGAHKSENPVNDTAAIIGNFAVYLMEQAPETGEETGVPPRQPINAAMYIESKGLPAFRL